MDGPPPLRLETIHELLNHAKRLFAGLYAVRHKLKMESEYKFVTTKDAGKIIRTKNNSGTIKTWGQLLRYPVAVLYHFKNFQLATLNALKGIATNCRDIDCMLHYTFGKPVMELFTAYVKLHIFFTEIPNVMAAVSLYRDLAAGLGKPDPNISSLLDFVKERETLKPVIVELQNIFCSPSSRIFCRGYSSPSARLPLFHGDFSSLPMVLSHISQVTSFLIQTISFSSIYLRSSNFLSFQA
jgi:hypothetical protein